MLEVAAKIEFKFHSVDNLKSVNDIYQKIKNDKSNCINFYWLGIRDYNQIWDLQKKVHKLKIKEKIGDVVLLLEHNHVYTLGKNANENHIITSNESIERVKIDRGGDVTYHTGSKSVLMCDNAIINNSKIISHQKSNNRSK